MIKSFVNTISEKLWPGCTAKEKTRHFQLLIILLAGLAGTLANFVAIFFRSENGCFICNGGLFLLMLAAFACLTKGKISCSLNLFFTAPLLIYAFNISDFHVHPPLTNTLYNTVWWLLAGGGILIYFSQTNLKIVLYYLLSVLTVGMHLHKANQEIFSFSDFDPTLNHPFLLFSVIYWTAFLIRTHFKHNAENLQFKIDGIHQNVRRLLRESDFYIAQLESERDNEGNVTKLNVKYVNNAFEAAFKINLYEVQDQEANYVFNLLFRNSFDLNKTLFQTPSRVKEFYAKNLNRWFKVHVLKTELNLFFLVFEEITKSKKREAQLEAGRKRYKVLLEAIPDIFFVIDKEGIYEDFVIKEGDLFKVENSDIIGSTIFEVGFPENMANKILECIQSCLKYNTIETIEYSLNTARGTYLFEMRLAKLTSRSVISVARDITKRKVAEMNLEKALDKAEESNRLKSAFLSNLSHEIRTPVNIITHLTRMLAEAEFNTKEKTELTDAIFQNGKQLLNMIENTVHLSKIETGTVEVNRKLCLVNDVVRKVYNQHLPLLPDSKSIQLKLNLDVPNKEFGFKTDGTLLQEILVILVDNALKFTKNGEINLGYKMHLNETICFEVGDTGIGIPEEERENIFSRFYRVKNEINASTSGSGIGLPIAQHYVVLLGGELKFDSKPGQGSHFWFELPFSDGQGFLKVLY